MNWARLGREEEEEEMEKTMWEKVVDGVDGGISGVEWGSGMGWRM